MQISAAENNPEITKSPTFTVWSSHVIDFPFLLNNKPSAFTYFVGFKVNSGEYKLMGLAPYGKPKYKNIILDSNNEYYN